MIVAPPLDRPLADALPPSDARPVDPVKAAVFERINRDRAAARLAPVAWDEAASRVADAFCAEQIRENTSGHYLTNGVPPYARTAFAGVFGMQFENSTTWKTTASSFDEPVEKLALEGHAEMLGEKPPYDGHRRTILDPNATHVGLGYALERGDFRMAQEFLTRHLAWLWLERVANVSGVVRVRGEPIPGRRLLFVSIGWEPAPRPLTRAEASGRTSYSYSKPIEAFVREGNATLKVVGARTSDRIHFGADREFSFRFAPDRSGLWTLVFHTTALGEEHPVPGGVASVWVDASDR
ncbi:MAG TPA: CAP domain-containing protein [Thermoanaerobaculia bacterium]